MFKKMKILMVFGTRPEAIKLVPLIKSMQMHSDMFEVKLCATAQHREMLDHVLCFFNVQTDYDLNIMMPNQTLFDITSLCLKKIENVIDDFCPDMICVQGDTTTSFIGALAGFYKKTKIIHIEAGLRSGDKMSPYPEEMNRILISKLVDYHFAPTEKTFENLRIENISENVFVVGNTVIDALHIGLEMLKNNEETYQNYFNFLNFSKKIILVTGHRRENFGASFNNIFSALKELAIRFDDIEIVYPVHMNPNVRKPAYSILQNIPNIHLVHPLEYPHFIWLMNKCYFIITDSGGIQEEAPALGKPVLVTRNVTERIEGINAGTACLVGTNKEILLQKASVLLNNKDEYVKMAKTANPYGDGKTSNRIIEILVTLFSG